MVDELLQKKLLNKPKLRETNNILWRPSNLYKLEISKATVKSLSGILEGYRNTTTQTAKGTDPTTNRNKLIQKSWEPSRQRNFHKLQVQVPKRTRGTFECGHGSHRPHKRKFQPPMQLDDHMTVPKHELTDCEACLSWRYGARRRFRC